MEGVSKLKQEEGGPLLVAGSRTLVHSRMPGGLIEGCRAVREILPS